jgi:hypothetical protein
MKAMCRDQDWTTDDPLGIGGILSDSLRVARLMVSRKRVLQNLLVDLLTAAADGLERYLLQDPLRQPAAYRLAFRELGLAIGLHALAPIQEYLHDRAEIFTPADRLENLVGWLAGHRHLAGMIEDFWLTADNRRAASWTSHQDINMVMLATSLLPEGFLGG